MMYQLACDIKPHIEHEWSILFVLENNCRMLLTFTLEQNSPPFGLKRANSTWLLVKTHKACWPALKSNFNLNCLLAV